MSEPRLDQDAPNTPPADATPTKANSHFVRKFAASMPAHVAESFTNAQLCAIIRAYGVRSWSRHAVDILFTLPVLARTYYFVMLAGIDKRPRSRNRAERLSHPLATLGNMLFLLFVLLLLVCFVLRVFYVLKSAFGLNVAPGISLSVWDSITSGVSGK